METAKKGRGRPRDVDARTTMIEVRRKLIGMNGMTLAKLAGVGTSCMSSYEVRQKVPQLETALRIAAALGCSIHDLWELAPSGRAIPIFEKA